MTQYTLAKFFVFIRGQPFIAIRTKVEYEQSTCHAKPKFTASRHIRSQVFVISRVWQYGKMG